MKLKNSMTSSARALTEGGIVKPKVFAVVRLMTRSNNGWGWNNGNGWNSGNRWTNSWNNGRSGNNSYAADRSVNQYFGRNR